MYHVNNALTCQPRISFKIISISVTLRTNSINRSVEENYLHKSVLILKEKESKEITVFFTTLACGQYHRHVNPITPRIVYI